jgi:very-short-patch-repair endonuclease
MGDDPRTRSNPERLLRRLASEAGLPEPQVNVRILGHERDFAWPPLRLAVEVDGHAFHAPRGAREVDHARDAELVLAGWRVLRFTADQLEHERAAVVGRLRHAATVGVGRRASDPAERPTPADSAQPATVTWIAPGSRSHAISSSAVRRSRTN